MNKGRLIDAIASEIHVSKKTIDTVLSSAMEIIIDTVASGDRVTLVGFGMFESRQRKEREGRNPRTGDIMIIPPTIVPAFSAGKTFKEAILFVE